MLFLIIAIITAKHWSAWIWYTIGAVLQIITLIGNGWIVHTNGLNHSMAGDWLIAILIYSVVAFIIVYRSKKDISSCNCQCDMCKKIVEKTTYTKIIYESKEQTMNLCEECIAQSNASSNIE